MFLKRICKLENQVASLEAQMHIQMNVMKNELEDKMRKMKYEIDKASFLHSTLVNKIKAKMTLNDSIENGHWPNIFFSAEDGAETILNTLASNLLKQEEKKNVK